MEDSIELTSVTGLLTKRLSRSSATLELDDEMSHSPEFTGGQILPSPSPSASERPLWADRQSFALHERVISFFRAMWAGPAHPRDDPPAPIVRFSKLEWGPVIFRTGKTRHDQIWSCVKYMVLWVFTIACLLGPYLSQEPMAGDLKVIALTCDGAESFWKGKNAACGLDGAKCPSVDENVFFRCPSFCDRGSWLYSLRAIGDQLIKYRSYVIGGGTTKSKPTLLLPYRADLFPCGAAVHAGVVSPFFGGCAAISYSSGPQASFAGVDGRGGVASIAFDSFFPSSYFFKQLPSSLYLCYDPRLLILFINIVLGIPVVYYASGAVFFWIMSVVGFWTIVLATDPPVLVNPQNPESLYQLLLVGLERFLPTCFVLYVLWKVSVKRTFNDSVVATLDTLEIELDADPQRRVAPAYSTVTRVLLWYPFFWLGVLNNISFDRLPVDRLTWHDLHEQPGALVTVMVVALVLVVCVVLQAYYVWLLDRFWKLLSVYFAIFASMFLLATLPGLTLRIHHYIFALIFIPGCSTKGRTAYAFQGILLGLFLSGVARWGYASIAETDLSLLRGEPTGKINPPIIKTFDAGLLYWQQPEQKEVSSETADELKDYTYVSLLVNDIERYKGPDTGTLNFTALVEYSPDLASLIKLSLTETGRTGDVPVYLRLARYSKGKNKYGDYTRAAVLEVPSYNLTVPPPGIT